MRRLALAGLLLLAGCASAPPQVRYLSTPLPLPPRPVLPALPGAELQCLSDATYRDLVRRDRLRRDYAEQLEAIIRSTHGSDHPR